MGLRESNRAYLIPPTLFHPPKPKTKEKMGDLPKLAWSRDVTGKVDNIHSNLFRFHRLKTFIMFLETPENNLLVFFMQYLILYSRFDCLKYA